MAEHVTQPGDNATAGNDARDVVIDAMRPATAGGDGDGFLFVHVQHSPHAGRRLIVDRIM
ncbi:MAG: hypothetical protein ACR2KU_03105 [Gammaproteobacteria bacterium]